MKGRCSKLMDKALEGAASMGAETERLELIKRDIRHCSGCCVCWTKNPELPIGKCSLKDEAAAILENYRMADGFIFATPVYDAFVTSLMKKNIERMIALTYRSKDEPATIPGARTEVDYRKKASIIVTANSADQYMEFMGDPCFNAIEGTLALQQVEVLDKHFVGSMETITEDAFSERMDKAHAMGVRLFREIETEIPS